MTRIHTTRIRTVKPAFFRHFDLYTAEKNSGLPLRIAFEGLWTVADRMGRFEWRPEEIKLDVLPYDPVDMNSVLDALEVSGFIVSYTVGGKRYGYIPTFLDHQVINPREAASSLPAPPCTESQQPPQEEEVEDTGTHGGARADTCRHVHAQGEREREEEREEEGDARAKSMDEEKVETSDVLEAESHPSAPHFRITVNWFRRFAKETGILLAPDERANLRARDLLARVGGKVDVIDQAIARYFDNWEENYYTRRGKAPPYKPDFSFAGFCAYFEEILTPPAAAPPRPGPFSTGLSREELEARAPTAEEQAEIEKGLGQIAESLAQKRALCST